MTRLARGGFTLVEILVAAGLFALLAVGAFELLSAATRTDETLRELGRTRSLADGILERIVRDLEGALATGTSQDPGFLGNDADAGDLPADTLQFLTISGRPRGRGDSSVRADFRQILYSLETDLDEDPAGLLRDETFLLTGSGLFDHEEFRTVESLSQEAAGLDFEYSDGSSWRTEWDSNVEEGLPKAVRVSIFLVDEPERAHVRYVALRVNRDFEGE